MSGKKSAAERRRDLAYTAVSIGLAIGVWWVLSKSGIVNPVLLPSPGEVIVALGASLEDGSLWEHIWASMARVLNGFFLGFVLAVPIGVLMGNFLVAYRLIDPIIEFLRPIPPIAMIPLAILWFGIGEASKVFIIAYGAFFPILVNTIAGFAEVDQTLIRAARTLGASRFEIFRDVILRSAVPFIVVGARLGMGMAFIVLVAAELIASSEGLGYLINDARYNFRTDIVFLGMVVIGILGILLNKILVMTERRLLRWREAQ